ncbi:MAG TPA: recombination-associated protein RdgC [Candidatus Anaerobiospirillum pullistercoris]|uniref:Recombination-associated protein RdgC n=1 Tax=Candidatus Anaerobiospirillum pullistercoris TaxID=2838452 RepID=A0A9D1WF61_9GAMM|nr:recombination-associated protein RdgC [Candidatus Anaerobiospirillum pullistercoris]
MWFKNARIYTVALDDGLKSIFNNETLLNEKIAAEQFKPTTQKEMSSCGFSPVFGRHTDAFVFSHDQNHFLRFTEENKLLPSSIVNQALADEIDIREQELNRALKKSEKQALKTALIDKMMAQAFTTRRELFMWINTRYGFVAVSASSAKRAENAITILRKALTTFPAKSFQPRCVVEDRLTSFVATKELPESFELGFDAVLKSNDDTGSTVRVSKDDLTSNEVVSHIKAGKVITDLQLSFNHCAQFVLSADLTVKRLALDDQFLEHNLPQPTDDKLADLQANVIIEGEVLTNLVAAISKAFDCDK